MYCVYEIQRTFRTLLLPSMYIDTFGNPRLFWLEYPDRHGRQTYNVYASGLTLVVLAGFDKFLIKIARTCRELPTRDGRMPGPVTGYSH